MFVILSAAKNPPGYGKQHRTGFFAALLMNLECALSPFVIQSGSDGSHEIRCEM
jgi:hypothetical protein